MNFLPGWNPGFLAPRAPVTSTSFIAATISANSATITGSASILAGDILVLADAVWNSAATPPASSVPTGFVQITTAAGGSASQTRMTISYKVATGAEASASITGMSGTGGAAKVLMVFRPNALLSTVTPLDAGQEYTGGNPAAQTITAATGPAPLIVIGAYSSASAVNPRTFTVGGGAAKDGETQATGGSSVDLWLAYKLYNSAPADVVVDMDDEGTDNILESCYLSVA